jgi:AcrR family transcriptional regulator
MHGKTTLTELKSREREARKSLIIEAAERVFAIKPHDKVSMREIADEAGIATSSIYTYFPNQESLFVEATLHETGDLVKKLNKIVETTTDDEMVYQVINEFIDFIAKNDSYFRMMVQFMTQGNLSEESVEKLNTVMRKGLDAFDPLFKDIEYNGNMRHFSHLMFSALNGILVTFKKMPGRTEDEACRHMKDIGKVFAAMIINMKKTYSLSG